MASPHALNVALVLGPVQVGYTLATFLFGLTTIQAYLYYKDFPDDRTSLKTLVTVIWLMELGHQLSVAHTVQFLLITSFGNVLTLLKSPLPIAGGVAIVFAGLTMVSVQSFFIHRLWKTMRGYTLRIPVLGVLTILLLTRFALHIALLSFLFRATSFSAYLTDFKWVLTGTWIVGAVTDVLFTLTLSFDLRARRRTAMYKTTKLIDRLIITCVTTGMLTSVSMVIMAICFVIMKDNLIWMGIYIASPRFFSNAMLATLNSRTQLRRMDEKSVIKINSVLDQTFDADNGIGDIKVETVKDARNVTSHGQI